MNPVRQIAALHTMTGIAMPTALSVVVALTVSVTSPCVSDATPPIYTTAVLLSKQTVSGHDYIITEITIMPTGSTGWHTHIGRTYGIVKAGVLTHYRSDCVKDGIYAAGDAIADPTGAEHVHLGRNLGTIPVVLDVTYVVPEGAPTSDSAPDIGCGFA